MTHTTQDTKPEKSPEQRAERDRLEAERWFQLFENSAAEINDILKADFRLEEVLLMTRAESVRTEYTERLFRVLETSRTKENLSIQEELRAIHGLLTVGEVLKLSAAETVATLAPRLYMFTSARSAVVSGIAHQKFVEILGSVQTEQKRAIMARVSDLIEAQK